jgi:hypothetical protein
VWDWGLMLSWRDSISLVALILGLALVGWHYLLLSVEFKLEKQVFFKSDGD